MERYRCSNLSEGLGPRGKYALGVARRLRVLFLQRDGGEHRSSCEARCSAAAGTCMPEHEHDKSDDERERSEDTADDCGDPLGAVPVRGKLR